MKSVCVFLGSNPGVSPAYAKAAETLGALIAGQGLTLVYGGAKNGLMGVLAKAALAAGGRVEGVLPRFLKDKELALPGISSLHEVDSMHQRKARMAELADAFVALPGGLGTLEEIFEVATWSQLGLLPKPVGFLNVDGYWDQLCCFLNHSVEQGFLKPAHRDGLLFETDPVLLLDRLAAFKPVSVGKWMDLTKA